jgi:hypothetical protein
MGIFVEQIPVSPLCRGHCLIVGLKSSSYKAFTSCLPLPDQTPSLMNYIPGRRKYDRLQRQNKKLYIIHGARKWIQTRDWQCGWQ